MGRLVAEVNRRSRCTTELEVQTHSIQLPRDDGDRGTSVVIDPRDNIVPRSYLCQLSGLALLPKCSTNSTLRQEPPFKQNIPPHRQFVSSSTHLDSHKDRDAPKSRRHKPEGQTVSTQAR